MPAPSEAQIRGQIARIRQTRPEARAIGIRLPESIELGERIRVNGEELAVAYCQSVLEARQRLAEHEREPVVLVTTNLETSDLGTDLLARLAHRRLHAVEPWALVRDRFKASRVDPRLTGDAEWEAVARALLDALEGRPPPPPAPSGFLAAETVWSVLFEALVGLGGGTWDAEALLRWSLEPGSAERLAGLDPGLREHLAAAVAETAGPAAGAVFACLAGPQLEHALSIGLAARVLFEEGAEGDPELARAAVRLEPVCGGEPLRPAVGRAWADAAEAVVEERIRERGLAGARPLLEAAGAFLRESLRAETSALASRYLPQSYEARREAFAAALRTALGSSAEADLASAWEAADRIGEHALAREAGAEGERAGMALRLVQWLAARREAAPAASLAEAATRYRQEESYVDWARSLVWDADGPPALRKAYADLRDAVTEVREAHNRRFAELLAGWVETGSHDASVLPVERVLAEVVAPLARAGPTLLLVMDGMSAAVYRELQRDLVAEGWVELVPAEGPGRRPVVAALPSVTATSRTSLLAGELAVGTQRDELRAFAGHPELVAASGRERPPRLFHKAALAPGGAAEDEALAALHEPEQRVVAVVVNAVDDHLARGEQLRMEWGIDAIRPLRAILERAASVRRAVVLVSDHGHVVERGTTAGEGAGERWRPLEGELRPEEVRLAGPRVLLGEGAIAAPWTEQVRYGGKKHGYHGGASPQEVVIPLGVFVPGDEGREGWVEAAPEAPDWWERPAAAEAPGVAARSERPATPRPPARPTRPRPEPAQPGLFEEPAAAPATGTATPGAPSPGAREPADWIAALLASEVMAAQKKLAARTRLGDERIRAILEALDARGGKLTRAALARRLGVPPLRINGILSALQRLLNVDGYGVLQVDDASDTVELNRPLLESQFGI